MLPAGLSEAPSLPSGISKPVRSAQSPRTRWGITGSVSLPVGSQEVRAEKPGFRAAVRTGINLAVGQEAVVNLKLEVGELAQEVTVSAEISLVDTTTASVSGLVAEREIK